MKKVILIFIVLAILASLLWFFISTGNQTQKVTVVMLNLDSDINYLDKVINEIAQIAFESSDNISLTIISKPGYQKDVVIESPPDFVEESVYLKQTKDTLKLLLKDKVLLDEKDVNIQFEALINALNNTKADNYHSLFLVGLFPNCYNKQLTNDVIKTIKGKFNANVSSNHKITWMIKSNEKEPEQLILKTLIDLKLSIDNKEVSVNQRICSENAKKDIFGIFFNKLNQEQYIEFSNFLINKFGNNNSLVIWNDGPSNNKVVEFSSNDSTNSNTFNILNKLEKGRWTSIGFLLKQATNSFSQLNDTLEKKLLLIGNLPMESKGNQLDTETWKQLQSIKKMSIVFFRPNNFKYNETDKAFIEGLKYYKINYTEN